MDVLDQTKNHNGPFLFVEEDHYMAPSFLHALKNLVEFKKKFVSNTSFLLSDPYHPFYCSLFTLLLLLL